MDELKICVRYLKNDLPMKHYPSSEQDYVGVTCDYITIPGALFSYFLFSNFIGQINFLLLIYLPGWKSDITKCRHFDELPDNAKLYVNKIEEILQVPIWWIGVGQARDAIISRVPN